MNSFCNEDHESEFLIRVSLRLRLIDCESRGPLALSRCALCDSRRSELGLFDHRDGPTHVHCTVCAAVWALDFGRAVGIVLGLHSSRGGLAAYEVVERFGVNCVALARRPPPRLHGGACSLTSTQIHAADS